MEEVHRSKHSTCTRLQGVTAEDCDNLRCRIAQLIPVREELRAFVNVVMEAKMSDC